MEILVRVRGTDVCSSSGVPEDRVHDDSVLESARASGAAGHFYEERAGFSVGSLCVIPLPPIPHFPICRIPNIRCACMVFLRIAGADCCSVCVAAFLPQSYVHRYLGEQHIEIDPVANVHVTEEDRRRYHG